MIKLAAIVQANLVRTSRDRMGLFFIVLLPLILIVVLGLTFGRTGTARVGVVDEDGGPLAAELVTAISTTAGLRVEIRAYDSVDGLRDAASRGFVEFGITIPAGYDETVRTGSEATITYVAPPTAVATATRTTIDRAVAEQAALLRAARFAAMERGIPFDRALGAARAQAHHAPGVGVAVTSVIGDSARASSFGTGAQSQIVLFMFLTSLTGATELITTRQLGISRRMLATPTGAWTIIAGEGLARLAVALFQGFFIVVASSLIFAVDWGDAIATAAIIIVFALVCAGAALLIGVLASTPSQAGALGPALGMGLGLLGGTMVPTDVFPEVMRTLSRLTPHAWALDALQTLIDDGAGVVQVMPQLAVLVGFAAALLLLAVTRFRRLLAAGA